MGLEFDIEEAAAAAEKKEEELDIEEAGRIFIHSWNRWRRPGLVMRLARPTRQVPLDQADTLQVVWRQWGCSRWNVLIRHA